MLNLAVFRGLLDIKKILNAIMYTQEEAKELLKNFPRVDVMLSYAPPYGINDEPNELAHQGFVALREYLENKKPKYLFHGHTYPEKEKLITKYLETEIVYIFGEKMLDIYV